MFINLYGQLLRPECVMRVYIEDQSILAEYFNGKKVKNILIIGSFKIERDKSNCEKELEYIRKKLDRQIIQED